MALSIWFDSAIHSAFSKISHDPASSKRFSAVGQSFIIAALAASIAAIACSNFFVNSLRLFFVLSLSLWRRLRFASPFFLSAAVSDSSGLGWAEAGAVVVSALASSGFAASFGFAFSNSTSAFALARRSVKSDFIAAVRSVCKVKASAIPKCLSRSTCNSVSPVGSR